jgi:hypothetical protein
MHVRSSMLNLLCNANMYMYRAVRCVRAPKGSVVNFTAYQNFIELIQIILKYIEVLSLSDVLGILLNINLLVNGNPRLVDNVRRP